MNEAARACFAEGLALRAAHDTEAALARLTEAARLAPDDAEVAHAHAQLAFETWRDAAPLFSRAQALAPANPAITRGHALARHAEGDSAGAQDLLETALGNQPGWVEGHQTLTTIRTTAGDADPARSFAQACAAQPAALSLRLAWFHVLSQAKFWDAARAVVAEGERLLGEQPGLALARAFLSSESDTASRDPAIFAAFEGLADPGLDLARTRFWLRLGEPAKAEAFAARHIGGPAERSLWPYLALCWRLMGDDRAEWLDRPQSSIGVLDSGLTPAELAQLAEALRRLHTLAAPFPEQSVRGGTQTGRHLFFNPDPAIQTAKARIEAAVRGYIAGLGPQVPGHPLLGTPRDSVRFEGAWSVRLPPGGYHSCHTHNRGWISSALYVALPASLGEGQAGWIGFGTPPPELGLPLEPYRRVEPKAGRLVLFPSTLWHGTVPHAKPDRGPDQSAERLSIAFDVAIPH